MIVRHAASDVPAALRMQVARLHIDAWGDSSGHDPALDPVSLLLVEDGAVLAALDILSADLDHAGRRWRVSGLSTVVTAAAARGRGYGRRLVAAARETMAGTCDLGLFTCDREFAGFYERAGWETLPGAVLVGGTRAEPFPSDGPGFDKVVLAGFFTDAAGAARPQFEHARIGLYPGEIDRLW